MRSDYTFVRMDARIRIALKWLLVLPALAASTVAAVIAMELSILPDRSVVAHLWTIGIKLSPQLIIHPLHLLAMLLVALICTLPPASAIGFAARIPQRTALTERKSTRLNSRH